MLNEPFFSGKKILLIDENKKQNNDRTWCFWEQQPGFFQEIVYKQWTQIDFYAESFSRRWDVAPYTYKMIRGADFYKYAFRQIASSENVVFLNEKVGNIYTENNRAFASTPSGIYEAAYVFNSILFNPGMLRQKGSLLQHFKGWMIETPTEKFDCNVATFMDFRVQKDRGDTFVYVLPVTAKKALVEYTVFSPALLPDQVYDEGIKNYLSEYLSLPEYVVVEEEFGIIPMSTFHFNAEASPVINIGMAGGQTKGSSGYTFQFIQKHSAAVIKLLVSNKNPNEQGSIFNKRFKVYDDTLIDVLYSGKLSASQVFTDLFRHNKPQQIFRFLDNETSIIEDLKILSSVPSRIFLRAALKQIFL